MRKASLEGGEAAAIMITARQMRDPDEAARCVVADLDYEASYADSFVRLDEFRDALRYPWRCEVLIPFTVSAELIEVPKSNFYPYSFLEAIPRKIAKEGYQICSICKDEVPFTIRHDTLGGCFICGDCTYRIENARKSRRPSISHLQTGCYTQMKLIFEGCRFACNELTIGT